MALPLAGALATLASWVTTTLAAEATRFFLLKVFLTSLLVVGLPLVLNNFLVSILSTLMAKMGSVVQGGAQSYVMQLTGLAAYLADLLNLPLCVSILLGAVSVRFTLKLLRIG
jgi:hypothetical protein